MKMLNMELYENVRAVPPGAQKTIGAGRLKGMTDINPMWRIKTLTEQFGACGIGWYYEINKEWLEHAAEEITANVEISLYIKVDGEWSKPILGVGGSKLLSQEKNGAYVNDECYKMALTDAISVACKALGVGADVYWQSDNTKYSDAKRTQATQTTARTNREKVILLARQKGIQLNELMQDYGITKETSEERFAEILRDMED